MSCPKTEVEFRDYFFNLIGQNLNGVANNYKEVMSRQYLWNGRMMGIPQNVPPAGVQLPSDAPFYGLTQQTSGGVPKGRIWIPAAVPDGNNFYTRYIQYLKDTPNGIHGVDFLWDWRWIDGNAYVPICTDGGSTPVPPSDLEARVKALEIRYAQLEERVTVIENKPFPKKIALRSLANGKIVAAEVNSSKVLVANRDGIGPWEEFEFIALE